jgi:hypothetical protein
MPLQRGVQDKQIVRIIGKMTTLAAHAYHRNTGRTPAGLCKLNPADP